VVERAAADAISTRWPMAGEEEEEEITSAFLYIF
jgi:hypothetical protein